MYCFAPVLNNLTNYIFSSSHLHFYWDFRGACMSVYLQHNESIAVEANYMACCCFMCQQTEWNAIHHPHFLLHFYWKWNLLHSSSYFIFGLLFRLQLCSERKVRSKPKLEKDKKRRHVCTLFIHLYTDLSANCISRCLEFNVRLFLMMMTWRIVFTTL